MVSVLLASVWPALLTREVLHDPTQAMGLTVKSWVVLEPTDKVRQYLDKANCIVLPAVKENTWQCLTKDVIYSWNYGVSPSVWSESKRNNETPIVQGASWEGVDVSVDTKRQSLYRLYHEVRQEALQNGAHVYLHQKYLGAFVWGWKRNGYDYVVSAWREQDGSSYVVRVESKDE